VNRREQVTVVCEYPANTSPTRMSYTERIYGKVTRFPCEAMQASTNATSIKALRGFPKSVARFSLACTGMHSPGYALTIFRLATTSFRESQMLLFNAVLDKNLCVDLLFISVPDVD